MPSSEILPVMVANKSSQYMRYTCFSAKKQIPDFVFLSDKPSLSYFKADVFSPDNKQAVEFTKCYKHLSTNSYSYELFCFNRWFFVYEYARRLNYKHVLHFDTDVLICEPLETILQSFGQASLSVNLTSGHSGYFQIDVLGAFCDFLLEFVRTGYKAYEQITREKMAQGQEWGICDMNALGTFYDSYNGIKLNQPQGISSTLQDEPAYQLNTETAMADIFMQDGHIYLKKSDDGELEQFHTLHFQGSAKRHILPFFHFHKKQVRKMSALPVRYTPTPAWLQKVYRSADSGFFKLSRLSGAL